MYSRDTGRGNSREGGGGGGVCRVAEPGRGAVQIAQQRRGDHLRGPAPRQVRRGACAPRAPRPGRPKTGRAGALSSR